ncbi:MAG: heparinase II/III family protein, partial [Anaerolineaceae bacterium]|nr:heparinase II/III family protein [Anaerolineaceae bacterium]
VAYSETEMTSDDDYFKKEIIIDWAGWRLFEIPLDEFRATREPVGWEKIDYIKIASSGWSHTPDPTTRLVFDEMKLSNVRIGPKLAIDLPDHLAHPFLFLNEAEIQEVKVKVETYEWARRAFAFLQAGADRWLTQEIIVPETGGGFYHATDSAEYEITERHYALADGAQNLALMYQFTGEEAYLEKAREILMAYTESYLTYEIHDKEGRTGEHLDAPGRATSQGINEARWVIPLAWAYDLVYNDLTEAERTAVEERILRPTTELLMENNEGRHNHQTWYNSGVGVIGLAIGDKEYIWYALMKDDSCLLYQLEKSITDDGMWYEGSMHYQFYVLRALQPLVVATHHAGFDIYSNPRYKALFDFMVAYADQDMRLPTINDGRVVDLSDEDRATYYEIAYSQYLDPQYVPILEASERTSLNALLYGEPELAAPAFPEWRSLNFSTSNLIVLRSGEGDDRLQVVLNSMGYQGGHSHPDQLGLVINAMGMPIAPDAGSIKYREVEQETWFKQTLAHNTLVVDGKSQAQSGAGLMETFIGAGQLQMAQISSADVYPGVELRRTLLLNDDYLIDIFNANSDSAHTYDWVYHGAGTNQLPPIDFQSAYGVLGSQNGYQHLAGVQSAAADERFSTTWLSAPRRQVEFTMLGEAGTTFYTAKGPIAADIGDVISEEPIPLLIARREASSTQYVSIIDPHRDGVQPLQISKLDAADETGWPNSEGVYQIERPDGTIDWLILGQETGIRQIEGIMVDGAWGWISRLDGRPQSVLMHGSSISGDDWMISQEDLSSEKTPDGMGFYFEEGESGKLYVQNIYVYPTFLKLEGLMDSAARITELNPDGTARRDMPIKVNADGVIKFLAQPGYLYEIVSP